MDWPAGVLRASIGLVSADVKGRDALYAVEIKRGLEICIRTGQSIHSAAANIAIRFRLFSFLLQKASASTLTLPAQKNTAFVKLLMLLVFVCLAASWHGRR